MTLGKNAKRIVPIALSVGIVIILAIVVGAAAAIVSPPPAPAAAATDTMTAKVDKLFAAWDTTTTPGAALALVKDGKIVYERGYGMAKLEDGIINTPDKVFDIGSVSKQFTAACAAMLVREGKVRVEDDIRKYLPDIPAYEKPITVGHLLHHTSGLRDYNALLELAGFRADADSPTVAEALEIIRRQKKLNYAPGDEYSYTNTGFFLLSQIVERVSGKSLNAFAQERIFKPLGMTKTLYQDDHTQIIKDRATGYAEGEGGSGAYKISLSNWDETGDGNVYTTVRDLARWDEAFYSGALGRDLTDILQTTGTLNSGEKIDYAWGLVVREYKGLKVVEHGGAWVGFRAALVRFPEQRFSVIILANLDSIDPSGLAFKIADIYLAGLLKEPDKAEAKKEEPAGAANPAGAPKDQGGAPAQAGIVLPRAELEALAGNWQDARFGDWLTLLVKEGQLKAALGGREFTLAPVAPGKFAVPERPDVTVTFKPANKADPATAEITIGSTVEYRFAKVPPLKVLSPAELAACAGTYVSEELLDARYTLSVKKGQLTVEMRTLPPTPLKAMTPDKFAVPDIGCNIEFKRGKDGKIDGFTLSAGRASGIAFRKKS
jgi:CubicO group peptidase (beta-lactamase class C family)